jgi:hypothetical protein
MYNMALLILNYSPFPRITHTMICIVVMIWLQINEYCVSLVSRIKRQPEQ